jgi:hypothetical protein
MTKKEYAARKLAYNTALWEGRVLRFFNGQSHQSYSTVERRDAALVEAKAAGIPCEIVTVTREYAAAHGVSV